MLSYFLTSQSLVFLDQEVSIFSNGNPSDVLVRILFAESQHNVRKELPLTRKAMKCLQLPKHASNSHLCCFIEGVTRSRRIPATHLLVFMISPEDRQQKPYALPVQCVPYTGMPEHVIQTLANKVIREMNARGMKVAGNCVSTLCS